MCSWCSLSGVWGGVCSDQQSSRCHVLPFYLVDNIEPLRRTTDVGVATLDAFHPCDHSEYQKKIRGKPKPWFLSRSQ